LAVGCLCQQSWTISSFGMLWRMSSCLKTSRTNIFGRQRARVHTPHVRLTPGSPWAQPLLSRANVFGSRGRPLDVRYSFGWPCSTDAGRRIDWNVAGYNTRTVAFSAIKRRRQFSTSSRLVSSPDRYGQPFLERSACCTWPHHWTLTFSNIGGDGLRAGCLKLLGKG